MTIHLRQICLVADSLASPVRQLSDILDIEVCYVDPAVKKFGLENSLLRVGTQFIEVVAPIAADTAAGRYLKRRGGDGGYMVICQARTRQIQDEIRANAAANQVRIAYESDRTSWNIMQLHPVDMGSAFLEADWDQQEQVAGNWHPAGGIGWQNSIHTDAVSEIVAVELQADDPARVARRWAAVTGQALETKTNGFEIRLENARVRFVDVADGRGDGLAAVDLRANDPEQITVRASAQGCLNEQDQIIICGTRINLVN